MEKDGWDLKEFPGLESVPFPTNVQSEDQSLEEGLNYFFISGGISGAITDPFSDEADEHAERFYTAMRNIKGYDVFNISRNTGYTIDQISAIKSYLFIQEHELDDGIRRFDPSFIISESWRRLAYDPERIQPHDLLLIKHELREMALVQQGYSQSEAHNLTDKNYNYAKDAYAFHQRLHSRHNHLKESAVKNSKKASHTH